MNDDNGKMNSFAELMKEYSLTDAANWDRQVPKMRFTKSNHTKKGPGRKHSIYTSDRTRFNVVNSLGIAGNKLANRALRGVLTVKGAS